jgi:N-glycosylase/DNA lyase
VPATHPWSPHALIAGLTDISDSTLAETLDGGQAFRWHREIGDGPTDPPASWVGVWGSCIARVGRGLDGSAAWSAPSALAGQVAANLPRYIASDRDWQALADSLPWRSDPHLAACLGSFPGLRILRQPFGETLLGFLCSATKQIPQIKQMLALLAERHGAPLTHGRGEPLVEAGGAGGPADGTPAPVFHRLPTWPELAAISEQELRGCQLGFRAGFIHATARLLAACPGWIEKTENLPYAEAKARLRELPGVGEKIADCTLLFGAGRLEAFPVDTWILRTMATRYGLEGWKPAQVAQFGRAHFGPLAGLAQQYLFAFERREARRARESQPQS